MGAATEPAPVVCRYEDPMGIGDQAVAPGGAEGPATLAVNMGTSVDMIEKHYGHVKPLQAHKELTARYK